MFLRDLIWSRNIRTHLIFLDLADVHKFFKWRNVFSVMNIDSEKHKKVNEQMPFFL
jgi:hypothetical protein